MSAPLITASASILVAVLVFILNQRAQVRQERRQARLVRINSQLKDLYGPLNALVDVNERIWRALRASSMSPESLKSTDGSVEGWERWRDNSLMPVNRQMRDLIICHADLLVEPTVPRPMREFCAHVAALEIVLAAKAEGVESATLIRHPGSSYVSCVQDAFAELKSEQRRLLQILDGSSSFRKRIPSGSAESKSDD